MKPKFLKLSIVLLLFFIIGAGCEKEESLETDSTKIILGKWEIVEREGKPYSENGNYIEYFSDSTYCNYLAVEDKFVYGTYWIDTLLNYGSPKDNGAKFEYRFTDKNDKVQLTFANMIGTFRTMTYKRIK